MKEKFPDKNTEDSLEKELEYCKLDLCQDFGHKKLNYSLPT